MVDQFIVWLVVNHSFIRRTIECPVDWLLLLRPRTLVQVGIFAVYGGEIQGIERTIKKHQRLLGDKFLAVCTTVCPGRQTEKIKLEDLN